MPRYYLFILDCLQLVFVSLIVFWGSGKKEWFFFPNRANFLLLGLYFFLGISVYLLGRWIALSGQKEVFFKFVLLVMLFKTILVIGLGIYLFWSGAVEGIASLVPFFLFYLSFTYLLIRSIHWADVHSRFPSNR
jgi:hypothetical protein